MRRFASLLLLGAAGATDVELPRFVAGQDNGLKSELERDGKWWAHLGDHVYHAPPSASGLSSRVDDYYYAFGSDAALTDELRDHRVGGQGRLHIFHLPDGPSMLQVDSSAGSRRSALSQLSPLKAHMKVSHTFPVYSKESSYQNPLDAHGQKLEKEAVSRISADNVMSFLKKLTSFNTRSARNAEASANVQAFLQETFEKKLGYTVCLNTFSSGGPSTNVVAYVKGSSQASDLVVLGAHYDDIPPNGPAPGAEDNGSGVAALLAIMKAFRETGIRPKKSVAFVAFAAEEPGLLGSNAYAHSILQTKTNMDQCLPELSSSDGASFLGTARGKRSKKAFKAIIMDEVGWQSPSLDKATVNLEAYDWTKDVMDNLAQSSKDHNGDSLEVVHSNHPFGSDHMSFLSRGIPAVLTINGDDEAYPFYHTSGDKIEQVTGSLVAKVAKMNLGGLLRLAGIEGGAAAAA